MTGKELKALKVGDEVLAPICFGSVRAKVTAITPSPRHGGYVIDFTWKGTDGKPRTKRRHHLNVHVSTRK